MRRQCYSDGGVGQRVVGGEAVHPYVHPQHRLLNGCGCSDHLFVHHVSQLFFQHVLPPWSKILDANCTVRNGAHRWSCVCSRGGIFVFE